MGDNLIHKTKFAIGDWSDDGHGRCHWYLVSSNKTVEELREAHFKAKEVIGFDPGEMCNNYENEHLTEDQVEKLTDAGISTDWDEYNEELSSHHILRLWLKCLRVVEPDLLYIIHEDDKYPTMHFYGVDGEGRHLKTPGYGLFYL